MGDDEGGGGYYRIRIPETGDLAVTLSGGGSARVYVNLVCYSASTFHYIDDHESQEPCRQVLASHTYADLSQAVAEGIGTPPYSAIEAELATALLESVVPYFCQMDLEVTLTILSLTA